MFLSGFYSENKEKYSEKYKSLVDRARKGLRMTRKNAFNFRHVWLRFLNSSQPSMLYSSVGTP
jgi:ribosomal protein L20